MLLKTLVPCEKGFLFPSLDWSSHLEVDAFRVWDRGNITMKILGNFFMEQSKHLETNSTNHTIFLFAPTSVNMSIGPNHLNQEFDHML